MAGVGPFVVPAAKRGCFVFANDLNPESTAWMDVNRKKNHISADTLRISTLDGKAFIQGVVGAVRRQPFQPIELNAKGEPMTKTERDRAHSERIKRQAQNAGRSSPPQRQATPRLLRPSSPYIKHFIMNLPATAVTFLGAFRGSYAGLDADERARVEMPTVHCHYFDKSPGVAEGMTDEKSERALREVRRPRAGPRPRPSVSPSLDPLTSLLLTAALPPTAARIALPRPPDHARLAGLLHPQGPARRAQQVDVLHRVRASARGRVRARLTCTPEPQPSSRPR